MGYIKKHWKGELPLATSFWVNVFLLNVLISIFFVGSAEFIIIEHPVIAASVFLLTYIFILFLVYPWQIVGVWRSATNYELQKNKRFFPGLVKVLVVIGFLGTLGDFAQDWSFTRDNLKMVFGEDEHGDYSVSYIEDKSIIHIQGDLGLGISKEVNKYVKEYPDVEGIILDSSGGWLYEGREISKIILLNSLDTYTLRGCYSACGIAFISGNKRFLGQGANLGFHRYKAAFKSLESTLDLAGEEEKDLKIYRQRGVSEDFLKQIYQAESDDLWYPTIDELFNAQVIDSIVSPSSLKPIKQEITADKYFVIYINEASLSFSTGMGNSLQEASEIAKQSCGTDCRRAGYSKNACVALALANKNRGSCWGSTWGKSTQEAEEKALNICQSHGCECFASISECYY